ncbi:hypothetical protein QOZ80_9AG0675010 [Eleusine coracana subsp. coracana]|nr:hypothetical protein QOZ80_9AG0675010 [Eleusine coracana subsp. coracana]
MGSTGELQSSPWPSLPADLAGLIFCRLPLSHADRLSFMAICQQWRLAAKPHLDQLPPALPWLCTNYPTYRTFRSLPGGEVRRLNKRPDTCTPSSAADSTFFNGWLIYEYERGDRSGTCFLANPFTGETVDVTRRLVHVNEGLLDPAGHGFSIGDSVTKMIVCSPHLGAASMKGNAVGFYRAGRPLWLATWQSGDKFFEDIAFHDGKLYGLTADEELLSFEIVDDSEGGEDIEKKYIVWEDDDDEEPDDGDDDDSAPDSEEEEELPSELHYLVKSCYNDKLLMVRWSVPPGRRRCMERSDNVAEGIKLWVFEADLEMAEWIEVEDDGLDGQALFVSEGCSRAIRLPSDHGDHRFQGGRVYFPGDDLSRYFDEIHSDNIPSYGFYDLKKGTISLTYLDCPRHWLRSGWFFP